MMRTFRIGRLLGFPIEVNTSFLLLLGAVFFFMGGLSGLAFIAIAFTSVLLHELGHALVARYLGVPIAGIELHFFGGAAKMMGQPKSASDETMIAAAGPAVSFALGGIGMLLGLVSGSAFFQLFGWINLIIATFNLIPALPMDGGRIFRALLSQRTGYVRATEIAVKVARGFAVVLVAAAIYTSSLYLILLAVVLWMMGSQELRMARTFGDAYGRSPGAPPPVEVLPRGYFDRFGWRRRPPQPPPPRDAGGPFSGFSGVSPEAPRQRMRVRREGGRLVVYVD